MNSLLLCCTKRSKKIFGRGGRGIGRRLEKQDERQGDRESIEEWV